MNDRLNQWQHFLERDEEDAPVRRDEAKSYLEEHNIMQLFNDITSSPVFHRPAHPRKFMIEQMEKIRLARERSFYKPLQLKKKNANAIYDTLDPIDRGSITVSQYTDTMTRLGVSGFEPFDYEPDFKITREMFVEQFDDGEVESIKGDKEPSAIIEPVEPAEHHQPTDHQNDVEHHDESDVDNDDEPQQQQQLDEHDDPNDYAADDSADDEARDKPDDVNI